MCFSIILTYFIIGFVVGLFIYNYYCKDFNKKNQTYQYKLTWEEYSRREGPAVCMAITIFLWPVLLLIVVCYYLFQYPIDCIKKRNGIE